MRALACSVLTSSVGDSDDDDTAGETLFKRTILGENTSEYRIDGKKVTEKEYQTKLKSIGLLVKSRNFLVFQNEVTKVAQKSPKELTELIERVSGSEVKPRGPTTRLLPMAFHSPSSHCVVCVCESCGSACLLVVRDPGGWCLSRKADASPELKAQRRVVFLLDVLFFSSSDDRSAAFAVFPLHHPRKQDHKADYESLQEKKKEGSDKVVGLYRRKELVNKELKQCKEAVKEANLYQRYCDELKQTKTLKTLFDAYHLERKIETHAGKVEEFEETRKGLDKECGVLEKQMKIKGREKAQKQKEWATHDQSAQDIEKQIKKIQRNDSMKVQTAIKSAKADLEQSKAEGAKAADKKNEVSRTLKADEERLGEHEKDLKAEEWANVCKDIQLQGGQLSQYNRLKLTADAATQKAQEAYDKTNREQLQDDRAMTQAKEDHLRVQARLQERERQVQSDSGEKNSHSEKLQKLQLDKQKLDSDLRDSEVKYQQEKAQREVSPRQQRLPTACRCL